MTCFSQSIRLENNSGIKIQSKRFLRSARWAFLVVLFVGAVATYLFEVNCIAAKGFLVRDLEKQIGDLQYENEKLQLQTVELKSMTDLSAKVMELNMVPVEEITYFDTTGQVVARR